MSSTLTPQGWVVVEDAGGGGSTSNPIAYQTSVPFTASGDMGTHYVSGATAFTPNTGGAVTNSSVSVLLVSNGANVPTFVGFSEWASSFGYDNGVAGLVNVVRFWYDGVAYRYEISQPAVNTPVSVPDTAPPTTVARVVTNAAPTVIAVTMSEAMDTGFTPAAGAFTVSAGHTVSSVAWASSTVLNITVGTAFVNGEAARTLAYTQPGANNARDVAGNLLASFSGQSITNQVAGSLESEVTAWLARVATAGGTVSGGTQTAVNDFVVAAKANSYWSTFRRLNLFCGDAAASLVPLVNTSGATADTNSATTYAEATGRVTDGTSYIDTGYTPSEATGGISVYLRTTQASSTTARVAMGARDTGVTHVFWLAGNTDAAGVNTSGAVQGMWGGGSGGGNLQPATTGGMLAGLWHTSRTSSVLNTLYFNGASVGTGTTSTTPATANAAISIFARTAQGSGTRAAFLEAGSAVGAYGIDTGMSAALAALYRTNMQTFQAALSRSV
jgi:hypothetical protein